MHMNLFFKKVSFNFSSRAPCSWQGERNSLKTTNLKSMGKDCAGSSPQTAENLSVSPAWWPFFILSGVELYAGFFPPPWKWNELMDKYKGLIIVYLLFSVSLGHRWWNSSFGLHNEGMTGMQNVHTHVMTYLWPEAVCPVHITKLSPYMSVHQLSWPACKCVSRCENLCHCFQWALPHPCINGCSSLHDPLVTATSQWLRTSETQIWKDIISLWGGGGHYIFQYNYCPWLSASVHGFLSPSFVRSNHCCGVLQREYM